MVRDWRKWGKLLPQSYYTIVVAKKHKFIAKNKTSKGKVQKRCKKLSSSKHNCKHILPFSVTFFLHNVAHPVVELYFFFFFVVVFHLHLSYQLCTSDGDGGGGGGGSC